jgi:hypothetical protein
MYVLDMAVGYGDGVNEIAFLLSLVVISLFYPAYQKCMHAIRKEEMLDQFLKD